MIGTKTGELLVLSYNISFEAMTNNPGGSAGVLGAKCLPVAPKSRLTICAKNMAEMIDHIPSSLGMSNFDFVGMQEASRWDEMQKVSKTLSALTPYGSQYGRSEMVTFYDSSKYQLDKDVHSGFEYDRPLQILVLSNINDKGGVIVINAHCPHHLPNSYKDYTFTEFAKHTSSELAQLSLTADEKSYRIVAVGDFNETCWDRIKSKLEPKHFKPFEGAGVDTEISIKDTPFTCCQGNGVWENSSGKMIYGWRGGDYIFDSQQAADAQVPSVYPTDKLLSDHLPVIAILPPAP